MGSYFNTDQLGGFRRITLAKRKDGLRTIKSIATEIFKIYLPIYTNIQGEY